MKYLTQYEIDLWNMKKLLKKEQKKYTMRKNHQHPDGKTKQQRWLYIKQTRYKKDPAPSLGVLAPVSKATLDCRKDLLLEQRNK